MAGSGFRVWVFWDSAGCKGAIIGIFGVFP